MRKSLFPLLHWEFPQSFLPVAIRKQILKEKLLQWTAPKK
jgi:hypothetical protein